MRRLMVTVAVVGAVFVGAAPAQAHDPCESRRDPALTDLRLQAAWWGHFTICYATGSEADEELVRLWLNQALRIGREKYDILWPETKGRRLHTTVFLPAVPTSHTQRGRVTNICCWWDSDQGRYAAEIHYLTPAAWGDPPFGGLRYETARDYHAHYVVHEMLNVLHHTFAYDAASWIGEGLAEYDGYFHTTEWNRTTAIDRLIELVDRSHRERIYCCRTLGQQVAFSTDSVYYGGAALMAFLAERFGEAIHRDLLLAPVEAVLRDRGAGVEETFGEFRTWFDGEVAARGGGDEPGPSESYTPNLACTGRYWRTNSGRLSFEVRILNDGERPAVSQLFQRVDRPDASHPWTVRSFALVPKGRSFGNATPLFSGVSSAPFQWRARACETQDGSRCSNWSNTINWTAASCAAHEVTF